jgi:hypothetical protein
MGSGGSFCEGLAAGHIVNRRDQKSCSSIEFVEVAAQLT